MKRAALIVLITAVSFSFAAVSLFANTDIMKFTKNGKKVHDATRDGKRVSSCGYCHVGTGIHRDRSKPKSSQGFRGKGPNYRKLSNKGLYPKCAGSGCH